MPAVFLNGEWRIENGELAGASRDIFNFPFSIKKAPENCLPA
jgi:hypothetical protein